jgi:hypothetical protein
MVETVSVPGVTVSNLCAGLHSAENADDAVRTPEIRRAAYVTFNAAHFILVLLFNGPPWLNIHLDGMYSERLFVP